MLHFSSCSRCVEPKAKAANLDRMISRVSCKLSYPMYCVPLSEALKMTSVERHEVLLSRGALVQHSIVDSEPVIFLSHQWISTKHPDPEAEQFTVFQQAVQRLLAGYEVRSDWLHSYSTMKHEVCDNWPVLLTNARVWYDYFSVPQEARNKGDALLAIESIPAYIEMSMITFILAPTLDHKESVDDAGHARACDYFTWQKRGWCRLELLATYLKVKARCPVVIRSEKYMHFMPVAFFASQCRVAEGDFACCTLGHTRVNSDEKASPLLCDKISLFPVVDALVRRRLSYELRNGHARAARQLKAYSHIWMHDLGHDDSDLDSRHDALDVFLYSYAFDTPHEFDGGWTPLRLACIAGNVMAARQLIEEKADIEANLESAGGDNFPIEKGSSILCHVIRLCCSSVHEEILDLLVSHNAKLESRKHLNALTSASCDPSCKKRGARWFLRTFPDADVNKKSIGDDNTKIARWPLYITLFTSEDLEYVRLLCDHNADLELETWPMSSNAFTVARAFCPTARPELAAYILHRVQQRRQKGGTHGATGTHIQPITDDVNRRLGMTAPWWFRILLKAMWRMNIEPVEVTNSMLRAMGASALLLAASEGKDRVCAWLLDQKADASHVNMNGESALSLAEERGFRRVVDVLRQHTPGTLRQEAGRESPQR